MPNALGLINPIFNIDHLILYFQDNLLILTENSIPCNNYYIIFEMNFLKGKSLKNIDSESIAKELKSKHGGVNLIQMYVGNMDQEINPQIFEAIAKLSKQPEQYGGILQSLVGKLKSFDYKSRLVKQVLKAVNVLCYLVKNGNKQFAEDLTKSKEEIQKLLLINTHYYENAFRVDIKELCYCLEMIRHRARYLEKLLSDKNYLEEEREKFNKDSALKAGENETANCLKIDMNKYSPQKNTVKMSRTQMSKEKQNSIMEGCSSAAIKGIQVHFKEPEPMKIAKK